MANIPFIKSKSSPTIFDERSGTQFMSQNDFFREATKYFGRPISTWESGLFREVPSSELPSGEADATATYKVPDMPEQPSTLSTMTRMMKAITKKAMEQRRTGALQTIEGEVGDLSKMPTSTLGSVVNFVQQAQESGGLREMYQSTVDFFKDQQSLARQNLQLLLNNNALSSLDEKDLITLGLQAGLPQKQIMALTESQKANVSVINSYVNGVEMGIVNFDSVPQEIRSQVVQKINWEKLQQPQELDTQVVTGGGRTLLINKQTGDIIKDLGGAYTDGTIKIPEADKLIDFEDAAKYQLQGLNFTKQQLADLKFTEQVPDWYRKMIEKTQMRSLAPESLQSEWEAERARIKGIDSKGQGLLTAEEMKAGVFETDTTEERNQKMKEALNLNKTPEQALEETATDAKNKGITKAEFEQIFMSRNKIGIIPSVYQKIIDKVYKK